MYAVVGVVAGFARFCRREDSMMGNSWPRRIVIGVVCLGWASFALSREKKLLVLDPQSALMEAKQLADLGETLYRSVGEYRKLNVLKRPNLSGLHSQARCKSTENKCLQAMGKAAGAHWVLHTQIQKLAGRQLILMKLLDTAKGRQIRQFRQRTRQELRDIKKTLKKGLESLFGRLVACRIRVKANVDDALVRMDGRRMGRTPLTLRGKFVMGKHLIKVNRKDYQPRVRTISIRPAKRRLDLLFALELKGSRELHAPKSKDETGVKTADANAFLASDPPAGGASDPVALPKDPEEATVPGQKALGVVSPVDERPVEKPLLSKTVPDFTPPVGVSDAPYYKKWWVWAALGVLVVAGTVGAVVGFSGNGDNSSDGRITIKF
jgi:hypothetical protein